MHPTGRSPNFLSSRNWETFRQSPHFTCGPFQLPSRSRAAVSLPAMVADVGRPFGLPRNISRTSSKMAISSYGARMPRASIFPIVLSRLLRASMISKTWCGLSSIRPVNSSKRVIPSENMSERTVTSLGLTACSGDMYFSVPSPCCFVTVRVPDATDARKSPHFVTRSRPVSQRWAREPHQLSKGRCWQVLRLGGSPCTRGDNSAHSLRASRW